MVDMMEHESVTNIDATPTRASTTLQAITTNDRTFLVKKMEITVSLAPGGDSGASTPQFTGTPMYLLFFHNDGITANPAEAFDAHLMDKERHNDIIWMMPFIHKPAEVDDAGGWTAEGFQFNATRTKSFPKGYPMDKNDSYTWYVFNPTAGTSPDPSAIGSQFALRVRYWGVYIA